MSEPNEAHKVTHEPAVNVGEDNSKDETVSVGSSR